MSEVARVFKARHSYDFLQVEPLVFAYLENNSFPGLVSTSHIEDHIKGQVSSWIDPNRLKHCISRALSEVGYEKRSKRGKAWEAVKGWCIRQADIREPKPRNSWSRPKPAESEFNFTDTHPVHSRKKKMTVPTRSIFDQVLCSFFPVY